MPKLFPCVLCHCAMRKQREKTRVIVLGGANIDIQGRSAAAFAAGDSNPGRITRSYGGVGRNIAENCLRLGLSTGLISVFGDDADAFSLKADCAAKGIDLSGSLFVSGESPRYLCLLDADGSLAAAVADMALMDSLTPEALAACRALLDEADFIVADANLPARSLAWLALHYGRSARRAKTGAAPELFLDTVSSAKALKAIGLSAEFDCVKPNREEAAVLASGALPTSAAPAVPLAPGGSRGAPAVPAVGEKDEEALCEAMAQRGLLPKECFVSLGEEGMYYRSDEGERGFLRLPPPERRPRAVNRSGAGDAACAALVWAGARGFGLRKKACFALTAAMIAASAETPVSDDLDEASFEHRMRGLFPEE